MQNKLDVAILGATGAVGQRFIQLLENHPWMKVSAVVASDRSAGKPYSEAANWVLSGAPPPDVAAMEVLPLDADPGTPLIFSALPSGIAGERELELAGAGYVVCSNVRVHRLTPDVPLLIPEVNSDHVALVDVQRANRGWTTGALVTSPNCTSTPVVMALAPLIPFGVSKIHAVSMQAVSGAGHPGVSSLDIFDNVVPYIPGEEEKLQPEAGKMLGALTDGKIQPLEAVYSMACNRVPVLDGHLVAMSIALDAQPSLAEIHEAWANWTGPEIVSGLPFAPEVPLMIATRPDRPQPRRDRDAGNGMSTVVGRLRECPILGYKFLTMAHNTVRGAAGGAILNAELMIAEGYVDGVSVESFDTASIAG
ncbi:aspartate-semialdehyde dehydrogenase [Chloroflexota bacterium]